MHLSRGVAAQWQGVSCQLVQLHALCSLPKLRCTARQQHPALALSGRPKMRSMQYVCEACHSQRAVPASKALSASPAEPCGLQGYKAFFCLKVHKTASFLQELSRFSKVTPDSILHNSKLEIMKLGKARQLDERHVLL